MGSRAAKQTKVLLLGRVQGLYRTQNIVKALADLRVPFVYRSTGFVGFSSRVRAVELLMTGLARLVVIPARCMEVMTCTHVILLAMNKSDGLYWQLLLAKLMRRHVIVDHYMSYYDAWVNDTARVAKNSRLARKQLSSERRVFRLADTIIFLNQSECQFYTGVLGVEQMRDKAFIIPLCVDTRVELLDHTVTTSMKPRFHVCWWGTYINLHGLEAIINAFDCLRGEQVTLTIFGNSEVASRPFNQQVDALGLNGQITIRNDLSFQDGQLPRELLSTCDLALGAFGASGKARTVLVNKVVDALSLGLPCLTTKTAAAAELLGDSNLVRYCGREPESIAGGIRLAMRELPDEPPSERQRRVGFSQAEFSPAALKRRLVELLNSQP